MIKTIFILVAMLFMLGSGRIYSQVDVTIYRELTARKDNLTGISVNKINEGNGLIWISTEAGIHIYDGHRCRNISHETTPSLNSLEAVREIVHYSPLVKFFIYDKDVPFIDRYDLAQDTIESLPIIIPSHSILIDILTGKDNEIWATSQTNDSLFFTPVSPRASPFGLRKKEIKHVIKIIPSLKGFFLIDSTYHFYKILKKSKRYQKIKNPFACTNNNFHSQRMVLMEDSEERLWWGPYNQAKVMLLEAQDSTFKEYTKFKTSNNLYKIWEDDLGNLIFSFASRYGFTQDFFFLGYDNMVENWGMLFDYGGTYRQIHSSDFRNYLTCGTFRNTFILKQKPYGVKAFLKDKKVANGSYGSNIIRGFTEIDSTTILVATESKNWYYYNCRTDEIKVAEFTPKCMYSNPKKKDNDIWAATCVDGQGTYFYLTKFNLQTKKFSKFDCGFSLGNFHASTKQFTCIGIIDNQLKLSKFNPQNNTFTPIEIIPKFQTSYRFRVYYLFKLNDYYWLATNNGLFKVSINEPELTAKITNTKQSIDNNKIFKIQRYQDKLLLSTERGLILYDPISEETTKYDQTNSLSNNVACSAIISGNKIWVPTFAGLNIIDVYSQTQGLLMEADGIPDDEFNTDASLKASNGKYYFGTANGMVIIDSLEFEKNGQNFKIGISNFSQSTNNQTIIEKYHLGKKLVFYGTKSNIYQFNLFSSEDYFDPETTKYFYTSESNIEPIPIDHRTFSISNLPFGTHNLHIFAISKYGFRSTNMISITILINQIFYKTWWFTFFIIALSLGFILQIQHTLKNRKERKEEEQKRIVAQLELNVLQAQLNPHFVFNSLGAIQNYIHHNNLQQADKYIAEFAQLMRSFLESSKNKYITISEELDLLRRYTELEKMRFDEKFNVIFNVASNIDKNNSIIPTFLLQPFVENAINHGLFHKRKKGLLTISIKKYGKKMLRFSIEDNGIGRDAIEKIQAKSLRKHKSRAMQIIQEKSDVLKNFDNYVISINTIDLFDEYNNPIGTKVNIDIPELE